VANARFLNKKVVIAAILSVGLFPVVLVGLTSLASAQLNDTGNGEALYNHGEDHAEQFAKAAGNGEALYNHGEDHARNGEDHARNGEHFAKA
jgi:hypothetical protein